MFPIKTLLRPRWLASATYLLYCFAGFAFFFLSGSAIEEVLGPIGFVVWNVMLLVGGSISLFGSVFNKHSIEMIGVPGVFTGLTVYSFYLFAFGIFGSSIPGLYIGLSAVTAGAAIGVVGRGLEIGHLIGINTRVSKLIKREAEGE